MRLHRLELEGFGPYRERQQVDFDAFADEGLFLISGRTGAGKSSILDGVCFALYGSVPRYEGGEKRLRSDHSAPEEPTEVVLEFSTAAGRFRIARSPEHERPKRRGEGMRTVPPEAHLDRWVDDGWVGLAHGLREVGLRLDEVLGLSMQQFLQVILLAQNRFARFLLADNKERQSLLRTLFGTRRYEEYERALETRRRDAEQDFVHAGAGVVLLLDEAERTIAEHEQEWRTTADGYPDDASTETPGDAPADPQARLDAIERAQQRIIYRLQAQERHRDDAERVMVQADADLVARRAVRARQQERLVARTELAAIEAESDPIDAVRDQWRQAVRAEAVRAPLERVASTEQTLVAAEATGAEALRDWRRVAGSGTDDAAGAGAQVDPISAEALRAFVDDLTGSLAVWAKAEESERALIEVRADLERVRATDVELGVALEELAGRRAALPERLQRCERDLESARLTAATAATCATERDRAADRRAAARDEPRAAEQAAAAAAAYEGARAAAEQAGHTVATLLRRRLAGFAGEVAAALVEGEPCLVCGSMTHPHPATATDDPVGDEDIAQAERARDAALTAERAASEQALTLGAAHARLRERTGEIDLATAEADLVRAQERLDAAERAQEDLDRLGAELTALRELDAAAEIEAQAAVEERTALRARLAVLDQRVQTLVAEVDTARGECHSVAERVADARRALEVATTLLAALRASATAEQAHEEARADAERHLGEAGFPDAVTALAALRSETVRAGLDARVRAHEAALAAARDRLRELELALAGEPDEPVDTAAQEDAAALARHRWSELVRKTGRARERVDRLTDLHRRAAAGAVQAGERAVARDTIAALAGAVAGRNELRMTLETFVLAAELEEIVEAANVRLAEMSEGRYRLRHTDTRAARGAASGLGLEVLDAYTGLARPTPSLSGGESFLASLALALGLAEVVTARAGGVRLETLFVDEGFGSLDPDTLELAMQTLDELRQGGRTVGVISHVDAMKERIPAQLEVEVTPRGPSVIRPRGL